MVTGPELVTKYVKSFTVTVPEEGSAPALSNTLTYGRTYTKDPASGLVSTITHNATLNVGEQPYAASQMVDVKPLSAQATGEITYTSPEGRSTSILYDYLERITEVVAPETPVAAYSYEDDRILTTSVYATDDTERENPLEINFQYSGKNQVVEATLPDTSRISYAYDPVGRLTKIMRPYDTYFTSVIRFDYDTNGFMTSLTTPIGGAHNFDYDGKGRLLSHVTPMSREYAYSYDDAGRPVETLLPSGSTVSVDYDTAGRLYTISIPGRTTTYAYDTKGRLGSVSAGTESVAFAYGGDLPVNITQSGVLGHTTTMTYNNLFEPVSLGYAGATVAYTYDKDGLLTSAGNITVNRSAESGRVNNITDGAVTTSFTYTGFGEVAEAVTTKGSTELASLTLAYHPETRRIMEKTEALTGGSTAYYRYAYDGLGRLTQVIDAADMVVESYQYDANNRRTVGNGRTYLYDADDRLLAVGGGAEDTYYEYSEDGYMTAREEGDSRTEYGYTTTGQLVSVTRLVYVEVEGQGSWVPDESAPAITYHLDALGRRVAKQVGATIVEKYLWAGFNTTLLAVYDGSDNLIARFDYGVGRMPVRMTQGGNTYYLAYDQVGSLRGFFNASGNLVHEIRYDAWGNILFETAGSGLCVPFGFAGGLHDRDTDLVLFGFRDYEPDTGRWTTQDPIGFSGGGLCLYEYCSGDPLNTIDPVGLLEWYDSWLNTATNFAAGFGDIVSFGGCSNVRGLTGLNAYVDGSSSSYEAGQWAGFGWSLSSGPGRLIYATTARLSSGYYLSRAANMGENALRSFTCRNNLKSYFNPGMTGSPKGWDWALGKYGSFEEIIRASGRTSRYVNAAGIWLTSVVIWSWGDVPDDMTDPFEDLFEFKIK